MNRVHSILIVCLSIFLLSACTGGGGESKDADYDTTKKMIVDILQTEDGKKAFRELMAEEDMKKQLVIESDLVKDSINNVLISDKGKKMWENLFQDPTFVENFAKSMNEEQQKLMKSLMNDSDYQKQMLDLLQNPEITEQMLGLMKSQQFRSHLEKTIQETLDTPTFQKKIEHILLKAAEEQSQQQGDSGSQGKEGNDSDKSGDKEKEETESSDK